MAITARTHFVLFYSRLTGGRQSKAAVNAADILCVCKSGSGHFYNAETLFKFKSTFQLLSAFSLILHAAYPGHSTLHPSKVSSTKI